MCQKELEDGGTDIPQQEREERDVDVPPDIVVSVIRSSSGIFSGTLSAVSTVSGLVSSGLARYTGDPPPYEEPPSYTDATKHWADKKSVTVCVAGRGL